MTLPLSSPVSIFALLALLILVVPLLSRPLRVPGMVGLILAGVLVGPNGLNLLGRGEGLGLLSSVGMLYILFMAGIEIDLYQFKKQRHQALVFGALTFLIAETVGTAIGRYTLDYSWPTALLFGSLFASQTLLTYPLVSRLGLTRNSVVATAVGGTIVTDFAALLVLATMARHTTGQFTLGYALQLAGGLLVLVLASVYLLPRLGRWFFRNLVGEDTAEFLFLFACLLLVAWLSELAGFEAIIGAFLTGLALNRLVPEQSRLMNRVQFVGNALFIPIFLLSVGMVVDLRIFRAGWSAWQVAGIMLATVFAVKYLAVQVTRRLFHYSGDQAGLMFGMIINKAVFTLAAVLIGYQTKPQLLNVEILNGTILMILVSCVAGPWITEFYGRRLALQDSTAGNPKGPAAQQRILVSLANPDTADALMDIAFLVRDRRAGQPVCPLSVAPDGPAAQGEVVRIEKMLGLAVVRAAAADVPVHAETRLDADVAAAIARAATELRSNCLIVGWNGEVTVPRAVFGRVTDRLLERTSDLLLVCEVRQPANTFQRLVLIVPPLAERLSGFVEALETVKRLAFHAGLKLIVVGLRRDLPALLHAIDAIPMAMPTESVPLEVWSGVWPVLEQNRRDNDLVVLLSCRSGSVAWQPGLDRIPPRYCKLFPQGSLVVLYPAEASPDTSPPLDGGDQPTARLPAVLAREHVTFDLRAGTPHEAVERVVGEYLAALHEPRPDKACLLAEALLQSTLEITPGVVLLHVHCDDPERPVVLLGISETGLAFDGVSNPVHGIFVLLSPAAHPPAEHLRTLSDIARLVMGAPHIEGIGGARTLEALSALLSPTGGQPPPESGARSERG